jgi:hypothetical protein
MSYIVYDKETQTTAIADPFPSRESAEKHAERLVASTPNTDTAERFAVVEVPD